MKKFEEPIIEVIKFNVEDVITTSTEEPEYPEIPAMIPPCV